MCIAKLWNSEISIARVNKCVVRLLSLAYQSSICIELLNVLQTDRGYSPGFTDCRSMKKPRNLRKVTYRKKNCQAEYETRLHI